MQKQSFQHEQNVAFFPCAIPQAAQRKNPLHALFLCLPLLFISIEMERMKKGAAKEKKKKRKAHHEMRKKLNVENKAKNVTMLAYCCWLLYKTYYIPATNNYMSASSTSKCFYSCFSSFFPNQFCSCRVLSHVYIDT